MDQKEEIKTRLDIIDIINEYVALKPAGANHKALCPFHTEKTPSFMVSRDRQSWYCFGCSEGGDVYSFVMKMEGLDFPGALRLLAGKAGVTLRRADPKIASQRNTLLEIVTAAADWWRQLLAESPAAAPARAYLQSRQVKSDAVETFGLGYAPDSWEETGRYLRERGFSEALIFEAGLLVKKERGAGFYDRFRNRLMFPIQDTHGQVVGFGGRTLEAQAAGAKYINTPATAIYNKSAVVYNLHRAKSEIRTAGHAVLVEGYMDALASWEAGVKNVVAVSGTALTAGQIQLLKRFSAQFFLAFDADVAGEAAAGRGIDLMLAAECSVKVITLPFGKDPDECVRQDPAAWRAAVQGAVDFMEYSFRRTLAHHPPTTAENKNNAAKRLLPIIAKLGSSVERAHWLQRLANMLDVPEQILREALPKPHAVAAAVLAGPAERSRRQRLEERLLSLVLYRPEHLPSALQWLGPEHLQDANHQHMYRELTVFSQARQSEDEKASAADFLDWINRPGSAGAQNLGKFADALLMLAEREYAVFSALALGQEVATVCTELRREHIREQLKGVQAALQLAERQGNSAAVEKLIRQFDALANQRRLLGE